MKKSKGDWTVKCFSCNRIMKDNCSEATCFPNKIIYKLNFECPKCGVTLITKKLILKRN